MIRVAKVACVLFFFAVACAEIDSIVEVTTDTADIGIGTGDDTGTSADTGTGHDTGTGSGLDTNTGSGTGADTGTGHDTGTGSGLDTNTGSGTGLDTGTGSGLGTDTGSGTGDDTETGTGSGLDTDTGTGSSPNTDTGSGTGDDTGTTDQATDTVLDTDSDPEESWINKTGPYSSGAAASAILSDGLHYLGGSSNFFGDTIYRHHYVYDSVGQTWKNTPANIPDGEAWGARAHVYNDQLYLIGGYPGGSRMRVYHPDTNSWTASNPLPEKFQWGFASGVIGQYLYIFGGEPRAKQNAPGYKYDFVAQRWFSVAPIPYNNGRGALSSAVVGDKLFVLNGNNADGTTILQIYDSTSDSWSLGPSLNRHEFEAAATAVQGCSVYFFGGAKDHDISDSSGTALLSNDVNIYDTVSGTWATGLLMNVPKMWATAEFYNGQFYVLGGLDSQSVQMNDLAIYTP